MVEHNSTNIKDKFDLAMSISAGELAVSDILYLLHVYPNAAHHLHRTVAAVEPSDKPVVCLDRDEAFVVRMACAAVRGVLKLSELEERLRAMP